MENTRKNAYKFYEGDILEKLTGLYNYMVEYFSGDAKRAQHLGTVHSLARQIALSEKVTAETLYILETAALVHDCGIVPGEALFGKGKCSKKTQEIEGPPIARKILKNFGFEEPIIDRVCYLVGHHHTYDNIDGIDYQILVEADFLVNFYKDGTTEEVIRTCIEKIFKTETGKRFARQMFAL